MGEDRAVGQSGRLGRREFVRGAAGLGLVGLGLPAFLQACARSTPRVEKQPEAEAFTLEQYKKDAAAAQGAAKPLIGDIVDFKLSSSDWEGPFGFVKFRMRHGRVDGKDVWYIRTDSSDQAFPQAEKLVFVPKLAVLATQGLAGTAYLVSGGPANQPTIFSTEPGRDDYTPAWQVHRVTWKGSPRALESASDVEEAGRSGDVSIEKTNIVMNAAVVKWSTGELPVDAELKAYLGQGQLIEAPDTAGKTVTFKLSECFPGTRYIVTDHSISPAAEMTRTTFSPALQGGPSKAGATGRTNVFMNGIEGVGPMGFQPSAFDFPAGDPAWSPYWDHWTYGWKDGKTPRVLTTQTAIHAARDAGELDEFPGTPDTKGEIFTVNCPGVVLAPNVFPN